MPKLNKVKDRILFLSPTVQAGWEDESTIYDFESVKKLGQGAFGLVIKAYHKTNKLFYAIKQMEKAQLKSNDMTEQIINEVKIMYSLNHDNIVKLYNHFEDEKNVYMILEFVQGGQLYQNLFKQPGKRFAEKIAAKYISHMIDALDYIHSKNIIHRDIKPENILIDAEDNVKLADFGWSNFFKSDQKRNTFCGTLDYLAPEMIDKSHKHDAGVDIWSLGVLAFELLTGSSPFSPADAEFKDNDKVEEETKNNIKNVKFSFPKDFPQLAKDFVSKILVKNPPSRIKLQQMKEHPWIVENVEKKNKPLNNYSEQMKNLKKEVAQVTIPKEECATKAASEAFTHDEIYSFTRPDSIIKGKPPAPEKKVVNAIQLLNEKIQELERRNKDLEALCAKKSDGDMFKILNDKVKRLEEEKSQLLQKTQKQEESITYLKKEFDGVWKNLMEKEKEFREYQKEMKAKEEETSKYEKLKVKNSTITEKLNQAQDMNAQYQIQVSALMAENEELKNRLASRK